MRISGDDEIRLAFHCTGEELIIGGILGDRVHLVGVFGDDGLSEDEPKETPEGFLFWLKPLLDSRIVEHSADFLHDLDGGHQLKLFFDPQVLKLSREGAFAEEAADKEIGIDDSSELTPGLFLCYDFSLPSQP